jgi:hypothetical protein
MPQAPLSNPKKIIFSEQQANIAYTEVSFGRYVHSDKGSLRGESLKSLSAGGLMPVSALTKPKQKSVGFTMGYALLLACGGFYFGFYENFTHRLVYLYIQNELGVETVGDRRSVATVLTVVFR